MGPSDKASQPPPPESRELWDWIPSSSVGYPDEAKALAESEWASNDSPSEARRDQQIKALKQALKEAPRIIALLGAESADGLRGQLPAAVAANGKPADSSSLHAQLLLMQAVGGQSDRLTSFGAPNVSGWRRPETQAPAAAAAATAAAAAPTTSVRRRLFGKARICEHLDCHADASRGWEVNGARCPPPAPRAARGYAQPWRGPLLRLGWPMPTLGGCKLTPSVDSVDTPSSAWPNGVEEAAAQQKQQQEQQLRAFAGWQRAALALAVAPEHSVYDTCTGEIVRAVVRLKAAQREPLAITCMLEHSGKPLLLAKETCHFLIDQLLDDDYLGITNGRASDVRTDLPLTRMTAENRTLAHVMVDMMVGGGGGNLAQHAGIPAALRQQMEAALLLESSDLVDGHILFRLTKSCTGAVGAAGPAPGASPIKVHAISLGLEHRLDVMHPWERALVDGATYNIRTEADLAEGPGDALRRLLSVVAKDVRVSVTPVEGVALTGFRSGDRTAAASADAAAGTGTTAATAATGTSTAAAIPVGSSGAVGSAGPAASSSAPVNIPTARAPPASTRIVFVGDVCAEDSREVLLELRLPQMGGDGSSQAAGTYNPMQPTAAGAVYGRESVTEGRLEEVEVASVVLEYMDVRSGRQRRESGVLRVQRRPGGRGMVTLPAEVVLVRPAAPAVPAVMGNVALSCLDRRP